MTWHLVAKDDLPGYEHSGACELRFRDGRIVSGKMEIDIWWSGSDEIPVPIFTSDDGEFLSVFDAEAWRLV